MCYNNWPDPYLLTVLPYFVFVSPLVVQFNASTLQVSENDRAITVTIQKIGSIDEDFDVVIIPVPLSAGKQKN